MNKSRHSKIPSLQGSDGRTSSEPEFLIVGRVLRPHGVRGELRVEIHTDYPERFKLHKQLYLGPGHTPYTLRGYRFHQGRVLLTLEGIDDRNKAETLRDQWVWIPIDEAAPLKEGQAYLHQMLHLAVETVEGEDLGEVTDVIDTGANPVYVVQGEQGEILLPDTEEVVIKVDLQARRMLVRLIEGLR